MDLNRSARARANTNIALVKYWGKRDVVRNIPAVSSLSMTLKTIGTETEVTFDPSLDRDVLLLNGQDAPERARVRLSRFLDLVRREAGLATFARVVSKNNFPTAAGLASSASAFAALALAAGKAAGLELPFEALARLARQGSGSAPRSLLGGFVVLPAGTREDGSDSVPYQLAPPESFDLSLVIAITSLSEKEVGSTEGMERSRLTSPFYDAFVHDNRRLMEAAEKAVRDRDLCSLGHIAELSCFRMHAVAMASDPPILYWNPVTTATIERVLEARRSGLLCFVTIDAGPHVKVLCPKGQAEAVADLVRAVPGVISVLIEGPGPGAEVVP